MDIFNRPPAISEDTLKYNVHLPSGSSDKASATTFATVIQSFVESSLPDFLWHRDAFELKVAQDEEREGWVLEGRMRVGDCVDDEWCVVWLLREISSKWDVCVSVRDSDGEFLLIEAAEALPAWVKPTNTGNRVWIYRSHLHLIPISHVSPPSSQRARRGSISANENDGETEPFDQEDYISAKEALNLVQNASVNTLAPPEVEQIVWQRISSYPQAAKEHIHTTKAHLPMDIARVLSSNPSLVQKPVETFYTRDALQLRMAHKMSRFPPQPSVLRAVKMTRVAYAQLIGQKFFPPKVFGRWEEQEGTKEWRWRDVGMKIAVGFEMLYQESKSRTGALVTSTDASSTAAEARKDALRRDVDYPKYIKNLSEAGYFRGEAEGSTLWSSLEDKAALKFIEARRQDDATRPSFAALINAALSQSINITRDDIPPEEDSDDWLNIDADNFENILSNAFSSSEGKNQIEGGSMDVDNESGETTEDRLAQLQASKLQNLAEKVEIFVEGEGDMEGVKFDDEEFSEEEFSNHNSSGSSDEEEIGDPPAKRAAMDSLVPALEPSEYGKMPASFHSNSQGFARTNVDTDVVEVAPADKAGSSEEPSTKPIRKPILPRDKYDGVDSDDETDEEAVDNGDESEEDRPQLVGDIEVDMGEEEEEFLEFSRQALGITSEQWNDILRERKDRGAFVPAGSGSEKRPLTQQPPKAEATSPGSQEKPTRRQPSSGPRPNVNPNLDSFEAVMQAMDAELARVQHAKAEKSESNLPKNGKGVAKSSTNEDGEDDIEAAMDAELKASLGERDDEDEMEEEQGMDYNLIKNFLESFKSQGGLSGPVGNLVGRLQPEWQLPRDEE